MNKYSVLLFLSVAHHHYSQEVLPQIGVSTEESAWRAGDCLDPSTFSDYYGYVDFDCGDYCLDYFNGNKGGNNNNNNNGYDSFYKCYYDDYGPI